MARGSVARHNGKWSIRYDTGTDDSGRRKQVFKSGFPTKPEAQAALAAALHAVATGTHIKAATDTLAAYALDWLTTKAPSIRPSSLQRYRESIQHHIIPELGKLPIQRLTKRHILAAYATWERQGLAPRTRQQLHTRLHQLLASAVKDRLILSNPCDDVQAPRVPHVERLAWTAAELDTFLRAVEPVPLWCALWHVYAMTGLRRGEGLGLTWSDIDWERGSLRIRRQVVRHGNGCAWGELKTAASRRTVAIGPATLAMLKAHRQQQLAIRVAAKDWQDYDLVFARQPERGPRLPGSMLRPDVVSSEFCKVVKRVGLPAIGLHGLRHTHCSLLLAEGVNVKALAARLGHDVKTMLSTYAHVLPNSDEILVTRFDAVLLASRVKGETVNG